jgi:hypothetical protein
MNLMKKYFRKKVIEKAILVRAASKKQDIK